MTFVSKLKPIELWIHFDEILKIPRGSKNEDAISEYVIGVAKRNTLAYKQDSFGNIVVRKPAKPGAESAVATILQCHLDMVNEKNADVEHDFERDPIRPVQEDGYLTADGTTLGSDNGIGVAASLALMENQSIRHGPLEFLFTVDEETGLTGASGLQPGVLQGSILINLDTEEEGTLYVGCAGGAGVNLTLPLAWKPAPGLTTLDLTVSGLRGGHSGVDIHLQRANAVSLLARSLLQVADSLPFRLGRVAGGNMHNAIPREASARLLIQPEAVAEFRRELDSDLTEIQREFASADPKIGWSLPEMHPESHALSESNSKKVLWLLNAVPHGVLSMSYDIPDLVETSANLATVRTEKESLHIHVSNRSSVASALTALQKRVASIGRLAGATVEETEGYPGWKPNMNSAILKISAEVYQKLFARDPQVKAVHAGLECGIIGERYPGMDMVSFGPQIEFPHSPDERVKIESVSDFYQHLVAVLEELAVRPPSI